jgi:hypothetical protein
MTVTDDASEIVGKIAIDTIAKIRAEFFEYADRNEDFKEYMCSKRSPDDAALVRWLIDKIEGKL